MGVVVSVVGSLPRPLFLIRSINRYRAGRIGMEELERAYRKATDRVLKKVSGAGAALSTDGMLRWDDVFTPFTRGLRGVEEDGLYRFFDNNFYYRVPVITGRLVLGAPLTVEWFKLASESAASYGLKLKPSLPGPLTFALLAQDKHYGSRLRVLEDFLRVLAAEVEALEEAGAEVVELQEPSLVDRHVSRRLVAADVRLLEEFSSTLRCKLWVHTYFGAGKYVAERLLSSSIPIVGLDYVEAPRTIHRLVESFSGREVALGVVDARNTRMEKLSKVARVLGMAVDAGASAVYATPNAMLEFLPEVVAYRKVRLLSRAVKLLGSGVDG